MYLRQSTAAQSRAIGPFVDDTDFKTAETGLTIANTDIKLVVNGGVSANKNSGGGTHRVNGVYGITFDATDTATVGEMQVSVVVAGALPVFDKFFVLEEAVYDALFAASAPGYGTAQTGDSFARLGAPAGASVSADVAAVKSETASIQTDTNDIQSRLPAALTAGGNIKADALVVSDKTGYSLSAAAIQAIWDALTAALTTVGSVGKLLVDNINATVSSRLATAGYTAPDNAGIAAIQAKTDSLTFTQAGHVDANVQRINDVAITGDGSAGDKFDVV